MVRKVSLLSAPRPPFSRPEEEEEPQVGDPAIPPGATLLSILEQVNTPSPVSDSREEDTELPHVLSEIIDPIK